MTRAFQPAAVARPTPRGCPRLTCRACASLAPPWTTLSSALTSPFQQDERPSDAAQFVLHAGAARGSDRQAISRGTTPARSTSLGWGSASQAALPSWSHATALCRGFNVPAAEVGSFPLALRAACGTCFFPAQCRSRHHSARSNHAGQIICIGRVTRS